VRAAQAGTWSPSWHQSLADRTVLLIGYGGVGRAIEARLLPFETTVLRLAQHERSDDRGRVYGRDSLNELLPFADIVVIAVPLDENTHHLVDADFLALMPENACWSTSRAGPWPTPRRCWRRLRAGDYASPST